jgi:hypothetical protein
VCVTVASVPERSHLPVKLAAVVHEDRRLTLLPAFPLRILLGAHLNLASSSEWAQTGRMYQAMAWFGAA